MKRRPVWWLVAAMLVAAVFIMVWARKIEVRPQVELSFLGYTNLAGGPAVAYAVYFPPRFGGCTWSPTAVDSLEDGIWHLNSGLGPRSQQIVMNNPRSARATNDRRIDWILIFPIANTNGTTRFRIRVDEKPPAPPLFVVVGRDLWRRIRRAPAPPQPSIDYDRSYWLTNEVGPVTSVKAR